MFIYETKTSANSYIFRVNMTNQIYLLELEKQANDHQSERVSRCKNEIPKTLIIIDAV